MEDANLKPILRFVLSLSLFIGIFSVATSSNAATQYSGTVTAKILNVREKGTTSSKKVGSLPKGSIIYVYAKTKNGWSETWFKNKKAYVQTKYLKLSSKLSFKKDKTKVYTFWESGSISTERYLGRINGKDVWESQGEGYHIGYTEDETKNGLYYEGEGERSLVIPFPLIVGKSWYSAGEKNIITSLTKTVKTPAGTFKNVIEIKNGSIKYYYARSVALIKVSENSKTISQLTKISKR